MEKARRGQESPHQRGPAQGGSLPAAYVRGSLREGGAGCSLGYLAVLLAQLARWYMLLRNETCGRLAPRPACPDASLAALAQAWSSAPVLGSDGYRR